MATYALTFATRAAFDASLASGDIYNLMQGVTSSKPSVAITATITESGETFSCGTNVMVDIKSVGPGDRIMYDSTNAKYFGIASKWIDNNYPYQPTQHIMIFKTGVLPARFVDCGVCVRRFGNRIRIAGAGTKITWSNSQQSDYAWGVDNLLTSTGIVKKSRTTITPFNTADRISFASERYHEMRYPSGNATYLPITRQMWDAAVNAGNDTVTGNNKTATLSDYDYSFDKFISINWAPLFPAINGAYRDNNGVSNTKKIVSDFINNHGKTIASDDYCAGYCYNYSVLAPRLGKHQWYLGTIKDCGELRTVSYMLPVPFTWGNEFIWSSSQYAASQAWAIDVNGYTTGYAKYQSFYAIPLADLILEN